MERGDISNEVTPRLVVVFEGMLGTLPERRESAFEFAARTFGRRAQQQKRAVSAYEINEPLAHVIWDTVWRHRYSIDVVTYLGEEFAEALTERLDVEGLPIGRVWADEPHKLARRIAHMPDVAAIYDNENHLMYGSKGRTLPAAPTTLIGGL
jgi:hypothetical protein